MADCYSILNDRFAAPLTRRLLVAVCVIVLPCTAAFAQNYVHVGNRFVNAYMVGNPNSLTGGGRFFIEANDPAKGLVKLLYSTTSCVVFRIQSDSYLYQYTNAKPSNSEQPLDDATGDPIPYLPFDSIYVASPDTVAVVWKDVHGFRITQRLFTERPRTIYDDGGDVIVEFSYSCDPFRPGKLGIFLMLDTYNSDAQSAGGSSDRASILTSSGYFPVGGPGRRFEPPLSEIPEFYHAGDFTYQSGRLLNTVLSIHRLRGYSHGGLPLTTPELFAVGTWPVFRERSWSITGSDVVPAIGDCATALRWSNLVGSGTVRTAFGVTDRSGNNLYHCRDNDIFIDIKTERVVVQDVENGPFTPSQFDVSMWVTNTSEVIRTYKVTLNQPIGYPSYTGRLTLDPSSAATQSVQLQPHGTGMLSWRLNVVPGIRDVLVQVPLDFRYLVGTAGGQPRLLRDRCQPRIAISGWYDPVVPPEDTLPPPIVRLANTRNPLPTWTFRTFDRHPGFDYDTGLDRIVVDPGSGDNFRLSYAANPFKRCDTNVNVDIAAEVIDTTRPACISFAVYDCHGNVSRDTVCYSPRPDIFKPQIDSILMAGSLGPECNARVYTYYLSDYLNQTPDAGDVGFGAIEVIPPLLNFDPIEINPDRANLPIAPFEPRASFRLTVTDSLVDAYAAVRVTDFAGNADTIEVNYCTLPDTLPPVVDVTPIPGADPRDPIATWNLVGTDVRAWDRGMGSVVALSSTNMQFIAPTILPGQGSVTFDVEVIDTEQDGEIVLEFRDLVYAQTPQGHSTTVRLMYAKIPDTMAPNIIFRPVAGSNGSVVDVEVNDIHYVDTEPYRYDRGLAQVNVLDLSRNMELLTPITFSQGDRTMQFRVRVIDTLEFSTVDSICLEAIDLYDNRSTGCYYYPLQPDIYRPIFTGTMTGDRRQLVAVISDSRQYDRGLGSIRLVDADNLGLAGNSMGDLGGTPDTTIMLMVGDPASPFSGALVIRDAVAMNSTHPDTLFRHSVTIPIALPVVHLRVTMPWSVEPREEFVAAMIAASSFDGQAVTSIAVEGDYYGEADYLGFEPRAVHPTGSSFTVLSGAFRMELRTDFARAYAPGDTLCLLRFRARGTSLVETFNLRLNHETFAVNSNQASSWSVMLPGDSEGNSTLTLPAPYGTILGDSITYVNGECYRILENIAGAHSKATGFAVLAVLPQPVAVSGGGLSLDIREMPADGAKAELLAADGRMVSEFHVSGPGAHLARVTIPLPSGLVPGAYFLRLRTAADQAVVKVMIIE